jgi:hypothetical protein
MPEAGGKGARSAAERSWFGWAGSALLIAVVLGLLADAQLRLVPGPFSIDEVTYHLMAKNAAQGRLFIWNGFEELPSAELQTVQIRATAGGLSAQYPQGYALLAAPFIAIFGYSGLFALNALAFCIAVVLCQRLAFGVLRSAPWAALAAALWAFATYSWEYALAIWPHSVAVAAILGSAVCVSEAIAANDRRRGAWLMAVGGLCCGIGTTLRLDVVLCALPLLAPLLVRNREGARLGLWFGIGLLPGIFLLSYVNLLKWGSPFPLSYGSRAHDAVIPWALVLVALLAAGAVHQRARLRRWFTVRRAIAAALGVLAIALAVPASRRWLLDAGSGLFALLVDSGALPRDPSEPAIQRTESGAVSYANTLKKAVLQSCPYFGIAIVAIVALLRKPEGARHLWLLCATPAAYALFYGVSAWHGGMCFNMRYLLPVLPFAAIASAAGFRELVQSRKRLLLVSVLGAVSAAGLYWAFRPTLVELEVAEAALLGLPLILAALLGAVSAIWAVRPTLAARVIALALAGLGAGWSACVSFDYDVPRSRELRAANAQVSKELARYVADDALLFAQYPDAVYSVVELRKSVRIALPLRDGFRDFRRLASFHARAGRRVYAAFTPSIWKALADSGRLEGFEWHKLATIAWFDLCELRESERYARAPSTPTRPRYSHTLRR